MQRWRASVVGLVCVTLLAVAPSSADDVPTVSSGPRCEPPVHGRDKLSLKCVLDETATSHRIHIQLHLTGSHDDTTASLEVTLGGAPVTCDAKSKVSTEGEDGDVTLDCRLIVPEKPAAPAVLRTEAKWFHAQFTGLEVNGRRP